MTGSWQRWGLEPLPRPAPPYSHVLGLGRMVLARFDLETAVWEEVDDYWRVDTAVTFVGGLVLRPGDLIVWLGPSEAAGEDELWPLSLVVEAGRVREGRQRVSALVFDRHESIELTTVGKLSQSDLSSAPAVVDGDRRRLLLGLWSLDVSCPRCGGFGLPIAWGLPIPRWTSDGQDAVPLDPEDLGQHYVEGGCVVSPERFHCSRCGTRWPREWHAASLGIDAGEG